jgi:hypothetical protein
MLTVQRNWMKLGKELSLGALMLWLAPGMCSAATNAAVSGVVRDAQGVVQMGAMVEVLAAGSVSVATAFTDIYGRYRIANLVPGKYQVRATAALFVPASRNNLRLSMGMRATVNLTLSMLADPAAWLPVVRRKADEPSDDWTWTLRASANRPILRMLDDGEVTLVSAGAKEGSRGTPIKARVSIASGDGGFGEGGVHSVLLLDRKNSNGSDAMLRTSVGMPGGGTSAGAPTEVDAGYERAAALGSSSRMVVSYATHPEMMSGGATGMQVLRMASADKMQLGDTADVEAGGTVYAIHMAETAVATQPFLRVTVHPGEVWAVQYQLATGRDLEGADGLDSIEADLPVAALSGGRMCTESGTHQEIAVSRKAGGGQIKAAVYHDAIDHPAIGGAGVLNSADMLSGDGSSGIVVDSATGSFRFLGTGYTTSGVSLMVSEPLTASLWAALEYASGAAISTPDAKAEGLAEVSAGLHGQEAQSVTAALDGRVQHTGTKVHAAYRWQPRRTVTAVDPYAALSDRAYLSFYVRQAVRWGDRLPPGLEATIDVTNLLAQGYQPFLSTDGRTLYLAQSPRTLQAGLSFTF